jgi:hypothetical protein
LHHDKLKHIGHRRNQNGNPGALGCRFGFVETSYKSSNPFPLRGTLH